MSNSDTLTSSPSSGDTSSRSQPRLLSLKTKNSSSTTSPRTSARNRTRLTTLLSSFTNVSIADSNLTTTSFSKLRISNDGKLQPKGTTINSGERQRKMDSDMKPFKSSNENDINPFLIGSDGSSTSTNLRDILRPRPLRQAPPSSSKDKENMPYCPPQPQSSLFGSEKRATPNKSRSAQISELLNSTSPAGSKSPSKRRRQDEDGEHGSKGRGMKVTKEVGLRNVGVGVDTRDVGGASGVIVVESQTGHALLQFEENDVGMLSGNMSDEAGITREGGDEGCYVGGMREDDVEFSPDLALGTLSKFPDEIIVEIFLYLDVPTIHSLSQVSRSIHTLSIDPIIWQSLYFSTPNFKIHRSARKLHDLIPMSPFDRLHTPGSSVRQRIGSVGSGDYSVSPLARRSGGRFGSEVGLDVVKHGTVATLVKTSPSWLVKTTNALRTPVSHSTLFNSILNSSSRSSSNFSTPYKSSASSRSRAGLTQLTHVTRPLNWREVYKERVELERRWKTGIPGSTIKISAHDEAVYCVQMLHDRLVTGSRDKHVKIWSIGFGDNKDPELVYDIAQVHTRSVLCLQVEEGSGSDGQGMMICGSSDFNVSVWELRGCLYPSKDGPRPEPLKVALLVGHGGGVLDVAWNKERIASCSKDATVRIWSRHDYTLLHRINDHSGPVNALSLKPDGTFVSAAGDGTIILVNISTGKTVRRMECGSGLACVDYHGDMIVSGSSDLKVRITDANTGHPIHDMEGHTELVRTLEFSIDTGRILSGSYDSTLILWDLQTGTMVRRIETGHEGMIFNAKMDTTKVVSVSHDQTMIVQDCLKYASLFA